ncbi:MAG TPA: C1 family peptidase [Bacilli bacterium]|nr:C1 family peptidase [Bacilli bacterium]
MKKKIILLLIITIFIPHVRALELNVCTESEAHKAWNELDESIKSTFIEPSFCSSVSNNEYNSDIILNDNIINKEVNLLRANSSNPSITDSYYNANEAGYVTSVKNQQKSGSCWAYQTVSLLETQALKTGLGTFDFSERHIEYSLTRNAFTDTSNPNTYNRDLDDGGTSIMAATYLFNRDGVIDDTLMPQTTTNAKILSTDMPSGKVLLDVDNYSEIASNAGACTTSQKENIKKLILQYGSVGGAITPFYITNAVPTYFIDKSSYTYIYNPSMGSANHAIAIVGWDDTISASNFSTNGSTPAGDGAWIVKNSWGTGIGVNGYVYVSYYDILICSEIVYYNGVSTASYDNTYNSSPVAFNMYSYNSVATYVSHKFTKESTGPEYLEKLSIPIISGSAEAYLSLTNSLSDSSSWIDLGTITGGSTRGIYSIKIDPLPIYDDYTIVVKYNLTGGQSYIPSMCNATISSSSYYNLPIKSGVSYYSEDGSSWEDLSTEASSQHYMSGCQANIYAYTINGDVYNETIPTSALEYTFANLKSSETLSSNYKILDSLGNDITSSTSDTTNLSTGTTIINDGKPYTLIIMGDVYPDGKITSKDYLAIKNHIMETSKITNSAKLSAADIYQDATITSKDYLTIKNMIMRS